MTASLTSDTGGTTGGTEIDTFVGIDNLTGGAGDDVLTGDE